METTEQGRALHGGKDMIQEQYCDMAKTNKQTDKKQTITHQR